MKVLLAGGGTLGSVKPLITIWEEARRQKKNWRFFWVGTRKGREKDMAAKRGIAYEWLPVVKWRRYLAWQTLVEPFIFIFSLWRSIFLLIAFKPDVILSAGSFIAVPVVWAGWLLRKKIIIHQLDLRPSFSNKLCARAADVITVSFAKSLSDFPARKTLVLGNPVSADFAAADRLTGRKFLKISEQEKIILFLGGSSGARFINDWVINNLTALTKLAEIVHLTGSAAPAGEKRDRYHKFEFIEEEMPDLLAAADLVVSRAGISTLSELSFLGKAAILVPLPASHQEDNAFYFSEKAAAVSLTQEKFAQQGLKKIEEILASAEARSQLAGKIFSIMPHDAREKYVTILENAEKK